MSLYVPLALLYSAGRSIALTKDTPMLALDRALVVLTSTVVGRFIAPVHAIADLRKVEKVVRGMQERVYEPVHVLPNDTCLKIFYKTVFY